MEGETARCPVFLGEVQGLMCQGLRSEPGTGTGSKTISYRHHHHHRHPTMSRLGSTEQDRPDTWL